MCKKLMRMTKCRNDMEVRSGVRQKDVEVCGHDSNPVKSQAFGINGVLLNHVIFSARHEYSAS